MTDERTASPGDGRCTCNAPDRGGGHERWCGFVKHMASSTQPEGDFIVGDRQYWLAEIDQHGNPRLTDGAHANRAGVEKALYIINALGIRRNRRFACAEVILSPAVAVAHDANQDALRLLNSAGFTPAPTPAEGQASPMRKDGE